MSDTERWVRDADLDPEQRADLAEYLTPRRTEDGTLVWPVGEVEADDC